MTGGDNLACSATGVHQGGLAAVVFPRGDSPATSGLHVHSDRLQLAQILTERQLDPLFCIEELSSAILKALRGRQGLPRPELKAILELGLVRGETVILSGHEHVVDVEVNASHKTSCIISGQKKTGV
jgi:hypothetical protein